MVGGVRGQWKDSGVILAFSFPTDFLHCSWFWVRIADQCSFKNVQTEACLPLVLCRSLSFSLFHIVFH